MPFATALTILASLWTTLPHAGSAWDILETTAPFIVTGRMDTGGVVSPVPDRLGLLGASWTQTSYRLGRTDITDLAHGGMPLLYPDLSLTDGLQIEGAGAPFNARSSPTIVTLMPIVAPVAWRASVAGTGAPSFLQRAGNSAPPPVARLDWLARGEGTAGGPVAGRVDLVIAGAASRSIHQERDETARLPGDVVSLFGRTSITVASSQHVDTGAWFQRTRYPFAGRGRLADRATATRQQSGGLTAEWASGGARIDGLVASTTLMPESGAAPQPGTVERLTDGPVPVLAAAAREWHTRWSLGASADRRLANRHHVTAEAGVSGASAEAHPFGPGIIGETVDGLAARVWIDGYGAASRRSETMARGFVNDTIALTSSVSVDAGVGVEHVHGRARGSSSAITWTSAEPRLELSAARGDWRAAATVRRYHAALPLDWLAVGDPGGPSGTVSRWHDTNGDRAVQPEEIGELIAVAGPGGAPELSSIDPALRRPRTDELLLAIERRLGAGWTIDLMGVARREIDLPAVLNTGVPPSAYPEISIADPALDLSSPADDQLLPVYSRPASTFGLDRYLLTNTDVVSTSRALQLVVSGHGPRWFVSAAATALHAVAPAAYRGAAADENDPLVLGDAFSDPNSTTFATGRPFFDRAYGLKISASAHLPRSVTAGGVARYADGQPFARLVLVPDLPQGPDVIRAYSNGRSRYTYTLTVDARVEKAFGWSSRRVAAGIEAFNLFNTQHEVEENPLTGVAWRTPTAVQPPRVVRLTVRLEWE